MTPPERALILAAAGAYAGSLAVWWASAGWTWVPVVLVLGALLGLAHERVRRAAAIVLAGVIIAGVATWCHLAATRPAELVRLTGDSVVAVVGVQSSATSHSSDLGQPARTKAVVGLEAVVVDGVVLRCRSPTVLVGATELLGAPERGSRMTIRGTLLAVEPLREPGLAIAVDEVLDVQAPNGWSSVVAESRGSLSEALSGIDPDAASLVSGLAIGDDSRSSASLEAAMRTSGLSHLLAVSGGNVAVVAGTVIGAVALVGAGLRVRVGAGLGAIVMYAAFVGPEPSVLRASAMGGVALVGLLRGPGGGGPAVLGLAVCVLIGARPGLAVSWGFALSVAATGGILFLAGRFDAAARRRWPRAGRALVAAASVTIAAQISTAPLVAAMAGTLSLVALPANLLAAPLVAPITLLGLATLLVAPISETAATWLAHAAEPFAALLVALAGAAAGVPFASVRVPSGAGAAAATLAVIGALLLARALGPRRALAVIAAVALPLWLWQRPPPVPAGWIAAACDVGQGDAFVVRTSARSAILIDTGPDSQRLSACLDRLHVQALDLVILTHYDTDHVAATPTVLARFRPKALLLSPVALPAPNAAAVQSAARASGAELLTASPGEELSVGPVRITVLWPRRLIQAGSVSNNAAVATSVTAGGVRMLFTGDLEREGQSAVRAQLPAGSFDVATIPHHGSANQDPDFLRWTGAQVMWVSAGVDNNYGHPRPEALQLAAQAGAVVGRTDRDGTLVLVVRDGRPALVGLG